MLKPQTLTPVDTEDKEKFEPQREPIKLGDFVNQLFDEIEVENMPHRMKRFQKWAKNRAFYRGNQRGFWDAKKRTWVTVDIDSLSPSEASVLVINNQFRPQVKTLAKEFSRSQTRIRANALSDSQRAVLTGRFADALIKYYQPKLMPESQRQREAKFMMLCGNSFRYTYYDKNAKGAKVDKKKIGNAMLPGYESHVCVDCGKEMETPAPQCTECGGAVETTSVPSMQGKAVLGYDKINTGDLVTEVVDPAEIEVWSGASCLEESPYLLRKRLVRYEFIKHTFPFYTPAKNADLSASGQAQWQFSDISNNSKDTENAKVYEYDQLWIEPSRYFGKVLEEPATFRKVKNGKTVEVTLDKGTVLDEAFPNGLYVCRVGKDILGYYSESKSQCWEHLPYDVNVDGFWADGLEDAVMNQQILNEYTSLSVENVLYNASPKLVINPELINPVTVTGRPKDMILMSGNARQDKEPKQAFAQISGMSLTNEVMVGSDSAKRDMREQTGALVAFNGQGDPTLTTATAMSIARDSALALVSTPLAIRAEKEQSWCWQILKYVRENWYDQKYKFLLGKYNDAEADAFKESVLEEEINIYVESNSWMPQTNYERLQNLGAYLTAFGLPMGFLNPSIPQVVREYATQLYSIPIDFDELYPDTRIAQKRLDMAKDVAAIQIPKAIRMAQGAGDAGNMQAGANILSQTAIVIANAMGVEEDLDDHTVFIDVYKRWLKSDEGQNAHPILREAVKHTMNDHKMFLQMAQAEQAQNQMMMGGGGAVPQTGNGPQPFQPVNPSEHPFAPTKVGQIQDFSDNAKKSEL